MSDLVSVDSLMKIITFLSDFGLQDGYVSQMKGVASIICEARIIDITHEITPHNIAEGAFVLRSVVPYFPIGTVHVAVVDPGVGTKRKGIIIATKKHVFIGPDNGLLLPAAHVFGDFDVYEITNRKYMLSTISNTFHGRDIFTPIASHIINGVSFEEIGMKIDDFIDLDFGSAEKKGKGIVGKVIYIDRFGTIVTNIPSDMVTKDNNYNEDIKVLIGTASLDVCFVSSYGFVSKGEVLATIGSNDLFELSVNQGNAAEKLSVNQGDSVTVLLD